MSGFLVSDEIIRLSHLPWSFQKKDRHVSICTLMYEKADWLHTWYRIYAWLVRFLFFSHLHNDAIAFHFLLPTQSDATLQHPFEIWNAHAVDIRICSLGPSISHVQWCLFSEFPLGTPMIPLLLSILIINAHAETNQLDADRFHLRWGRRENDWTWTVCARDEYK